MKWQSERRVIHEIQQKPAESALGGLYLRSVLRGAPVCVPVPHQPPGDRPLEALQLHPPRLHRPHHRLHPESPCQSDLQRHLPPRQESAGSLGKGHGGPSDLQPPPAAPRAEPLAHQRRPDHCSRRGLHRDPARRPDPADRHQCRHADLQRGKLRENHQHAPREPGQHGLEGKAPCSQRTPAASWTR